VASGLTEPQLIGLTQMMLYSISRRSARCDWLEYLHSLKKEEKKGTDIIT